MFHLSYFGLNTVKSERLGDGWMDGYYTSVETLGQVYRSELFRETERHRDRERQREKERDRERERQREREREHTISGIRST